MIGSFLGVVIDRLPKEESILWGRSHCDYCKKSLRWFELIPVFSFLFQKGRCRRCQKKLSWRYPGLEVITAVIFATIFVIFHQNIVAFFALLLIASSFIVLVVIDLDHMIIPDSTLITSGIGGFVLLVSIGGQIKALANVSTNIIVGLVCLGLFYFLYRVTKKRGIGFGDVKLAFILGFIVGYPRVILALYLAFLTGGLFGIILIVRGKKKLKSAIPFGPFMIAGIILSYCIPLSWLNQYLP